MVFHRTFKKVSSLPAWVLNGFLFAVLFLFIAGVTIVYINNERVFYFWDYKGYQDRAQELALYFRNLQNPALDDYTSLFEAVRRSTFSDYSYYPALLPAIAAATWGSTRLVYIL